YALIARDADMPADITPLDVAPVRGYRRVERLPQVLVNDRFFVFGLPLVFLPAVYPLGDAVNNIRGVGMYHRLPAYPHMPLAQRLDSGAQLHAIVGG